MDNPLPEKINPAALLNDAVRTVATFKPKFNPASGKVFSDELTVLGTAFWLKDEGVLITCAHVIQNILTLPIELAGLLVVGKHGQNSRASIGIVDYQHDLAVLNLVDANTGNPLPPETIAKEASTGLTLTTSYSAAGTQVSWSGYPLGNQLLNQLHDPTYSEGVIGIQRRDESSAKHIQISGTVVGGYSGSPVIEKETGNVIGVVSSGPQNSGIFMSISFEHVASIAKLAKS